MNGYEITFFTEQNKVHHHKPLVQWLLDTCKKLNIKGARVSHHAESVNHLGLHHSAHFFELVDEPISIMFIVSEEQKNAIFNEIRKEKVHIFYCYHQVFFGFTDSED
jgi:uncharacterized protein